MKKKYFCLKILHGGDALNETQIVALDDLKSDIHHFHENQDEDFDVQACYLYASLAEMGITEEESTLVD